QAVPPRLLEIGIIFDVQVVRAAGRQVLPPHAPYRAARPPAGGPVARKKERCPQVLARPVALEVGAGTREAKRVVISLDPDEVRRRAGDDRADAPGGSRGEPDSPFLEEIGRAHV